MGKRRHRYDRQFKLATARLILEGGIPVRDLSVELDVPDNTLRRWTSEYEKNGESAFPGNGKAIRNKDFEIAKLKRENEDLQEEIELLKKLPGLLDKKPKARFKFIKENRDRYTVKKACRTLQVSRSGYYEYLRRRKSKTQIEREVLEGLVFDIFHEHKGRYGARRISLELADRGIYASRHRVRRAMLAKNLMVRGIRKKYRHHQPGDATLVRENVLNRVFSADSKNQVWVGDITYIKTKVGFLYFAVMVDVYSRKVVRWAMSDCMRENLVIDALSQAILKERPSPGLLVHTDRGSQYTPHAFNRLLIDNGFSQSMSRKGNP